MERMRRIDRFNDTPQPGVKATFTHDALTDLTADERCVLIGTLQRSLRVETAIPLAVDHTRATLRARFGRPRTEFQTEILLVLIVVLALDEERIWDLARQLRQLGTPPPAGNESALPAAWEHPVAKLFERPRMKATGRRAVRCG